MKQTELAIYVFIAIFFIYLMMNTGMCMMREGMTSIGCVDKKCPDGCSKPTRQSGNCIEDGIVKDNDGKCYIRHKCPWECHDTFDECKYDKCCEGCNPPDYFYVPTSCGNHEESNIQHLNHTVSEKDIRSPSTQPSPIPSQPTSNSHSHSSQPSQFNPSNDCIQNDSGPKGYEDSIHF